MKNKQNHVRITKEKNWLFCIFHFFFLFLFLAIAIQNIFIICEKNRRKGNKSINSYPFLCLFLLIFRRILVLFFFSSSNHHHHQFNVALLWFVFSLFTFHFIDNLELKEKENGNQKVSKVLLRFFYISFRKTFMNFIFLSIKILNTQTNKMIEREWSEIKFKNRKKIYKPKMDFKITNLVNFSFEWLKQCQQEEEEEKWR